MHRHWIVDLGEAGVRAGHGLPRRDVIDKLTPHGLGSPTKGCERYRATFLSILKLSIRLALHPGFLSHVGLGKSNCLPHGAKPAARGYHGRVARSVQSLG